MQQAIVSEAEGGEKLEAEEQPEKSWYPGVNADDEATEDEGDRLSFASLFGESTDEEPEIVDESLMVSQRRLQPRNSSLPDQLQCCFDEFPDCSALFCNCSWSIAA